MTRVPSEIQTLKSSPVSFRTFLKRHLPLLAILLAYLAIQIPFMDTVPLWDGGFYFEAVIKAAQSVHFSREGLACLNFCGHTSWAYGLYMLSGQLINPGNPVLVHASNMILGILAIVSFYSVLNYFTPQAKNTFEITMATALFALNPLFLGCSMGLSLDFPVAVFITMVLASYFYKRKTFLLVSSIMLIFSKEAGILLYLTLIVGHAAVSWIENRGALKIDANTPSDLMEETGPEKDNFLFHVTLAIPVFIYPIYEWCLAPIGGWNIGGVALQISNGFNCIGVNKSVILLRAGEIFILNFNWIISIIMTCGIWKILSRYFSTATTLPVYGKRASSILILSGILCPFILFNFFYITSVHPRYVLPAVPLMLMLFYFILPMVVPNRMAKGIVLFSLGFLFLIQAYFPIDPLSNAFFGTVNFGGRTLLGIGLENANKRWDGLVYNLQYLYIEKLMNQLNKSISITPDTTLLLYHRPGDIHPNEFLPFYENTPVRVDSKTLKRTYQANGSFDYKIINTRQLAGISVLPEQAYYVALPWIENIDFIVSSDLKEIQKYYRVAGLNRIQAGGYYLDAYQIKKK